MVETTDMETTKAQYAVFSDDADGNLVRLTPDDVEISLVQAAVICSACRLTHGDREYSIAERDDGGWSQL